MSTVLTHATIYTGEQEVPVIKDAYIRFDKQIEAMGPMSELVVTSALSLIHISEPTRRTPISYAVFCLKKKKKNN